MSHGMARCAASSKTSLSLLVLGKSRMRQPARTDLCGGRPAMVVPTATLKKRGSIAFRPIGDRLASHKPQPDGDGVSESAAYTTRFIKIVWALLTTEIQNCYSADNDRNCQYPN